MKKECNQFNAYPLGSLWKISLGKFLYPSRLSSSRHKIITLLADYERIRSDVFGKYLFVKFAEHQRWRSVLFRNLVLKSTLLHLLFYVNFLSFRGQILYQTCFYEQIITELISPDASEIQQNFYPAHHFRKPIDN